MSSYCDGQLLGQRSCILQEGSAGEEESTVAVTASLQYLGVVVAVRSAGRVANMVIAEDLEKSMVGNVRRRLGSRGSVGVGWYKLPDAGTDVASLCTPILDLIFFWYWL